MAYGLAVGEEAYQFEHRDLHWGNVLIAPTDQKVDFFNNSTNFTNAKFYENLCTSPCYCFTQKLPNGFKIRKLYDNMAVDE